MNDFLHYRSNSTPNLPALLDASNNKILNFLELNNEVTQFSLALLQEGIKPGDRVGLVLDTSASSVVTIYSMLRIGAICIPLFNKSSPDELSIFTKIANIGRIFFQKPPMIDHPDFGIPVTHSNMISQASITEFNPTLYKKSIDDVCFLFFTSGTSSPSPKAVQITYANLISSAIASSLRLNNDNKDIWSLYLPLNHMGGISPIFRSLVCGNMVASMDFPSPKQLQFSLKQHKITGISLIPSLLNKIIDLQIDLSSLRFILLGGNAAPKNLIFKCQDLDLPIYPTYGATELTSQIATATPKDALENPGTVGRALPLINISIIDDNGHTLPDDSHGEIVVSGPMVHRGYYGEKKAFDTRSTHTNIFHTGDIGYLKNDFLWVVGRKNNKIITGGENVYPLEVENILHSHPGIQDVAVFGEIDPHWGEKVIAIAIRNDFSLSEEILITFCKKKIAGYKIPKSIYFVDSIPRTVSGTFNRSKLDLNDFI